MHAQKFTSDKRWLSDVIGRSDRSWPIPDIPERLVSGKLLKRTPPKANSAEAALQVGGSHFLLGAFAAVPQSVQEFPHRLCKRYESFPWYAFRALEGIAVRTQKHIRLSRLVGGTLE